jgi:hypothetical protein
MNCGAMTRTRPIVRPVPSLASNKVARLGSAAVWVDDARRTLAKLAILPDNWEGRGSPAIQTGVITLAFQILNELESYDLPTAHVGPVPGGGIGIEWRYGNRDLNLEILPDGSLEFLKAEKTSSGFDPNQMVDGQIPSDRVNEVRALIRWLMGS